jgi:hypothetical protein
MWEFVSRPNERWAVGVYDPLPTQHAASADDCAVLLRTLYRRLIFKPATPELLRSVRDVRLGNGNPRDLHQPG